MAKKPKTAVRQDERLIFFPTLGHQDPSGHWHLPIHGWIFRPEVDSVRRAAAVSLLRHWLGLEPDGLEAALFEDRLRAFLVDNRPRRGVSIRLADRPFELVRSAGNGHILDALRMPEHDAARATAAPPGGAPARTSNAERWLDFKTILPEGDERSFDGRVHLVGQEGISVISDIDDTIKITHVHDRTALLKQTFLREFEPVPGMSELYRRWHVRGATFHYVTRSPWQLYTPLADFVNDHGFPEGTFHMRHFRWKNASTLQPDRDGSKKRAIIAGIFAALPQRKFLCVGDSGEHDPEIYGQLARDYPEQVHAVYIRNVTGERRDSPRFQQALSALPGSRWHLFQDPQELPAEEL